MGKVKFIMLLSLLCFFQGQEAQASKPDSFKVRASALMGYDNNTGLNSARKDDGFLQETVSLAYRKQPSDKLRVRLSSDILNLNYFEVTDLNILLPTVGAGLDVLVAPKTVLQVDYYFTYIYFPNDVSVSSFDHDGRIGVKRVLTKDLIWRGGLSLATKDFEDRKLRQAEGVLSDSTERSDLKTIIDSDLSIYMTKKMLLKPAFNYYWNESNDLFHDYYDYQGFKFSLGISAELTDRVSLFSKFAYENRDYDSRPLTDQVSVFQNDDIYTASGGIFYSFDKHLSLGSIYSYRQKDSNEPSQKYSGSLSTIGLYYSF